MKKTIYSLLFLLFITATAQAQLQTKRDTLYTYDTLEVTDSVSFYDNQEKYAVIYCTVIDTGIIANNKDTITFYEVQKSGLGTSIVDTTQVSVRVVKAGNPVWDFAYNEGVTRRVYIIQALRPDKIIAVRSNVGEATLRKQTILVWQGKNIERN